MSDKHTFVFSRKIWWIKIETEKQFVELHTNEDALVKGLEIEIILKEHQYHYLQKYGVVFINEVGGMQMSLNIEKL